MDTQKEILGLKRSLKKYKTQNCLLRKFIIDELYNKIVCIPVTLEHLKFAVSHANDLNKKKELQIKIYGLTVMLDELKSIYNNAKTIFD